MTEWPLDILPLIHRLAEEKPIAQGLLVANHHSSAAWPGEWQCIGPDQLETLPFTKRYDLAVMTLYVQHYEANPATHKPDAAINNPDSASLNNKAAALTQQITRLRDLLARRVLILAHPHHTSLLHALGFSQIEQLSEQLILWQFNILSYKQVPDWLNSRFWANPENWNKYRW